MAQVVLATRVGHSDEVSRFFATRSHTEEGPTQLKYVRTQNPVPAGTRESSRESETPASWLALLLVRLLQARVQCNITITDTKLPAVKAANTASVVRSSGILGDFDSDISVLHAIASAIPDGIETNARRRNRGFQGIPTLIRTVL